MRPRARCLLELSARLIAHISILQIVASGHKIPGLKQLPSADGLRADRQTRLRDAVRDNPDLSIRDLARQEGTSKSTIHRLRKRLDEGVPL
jgi:hypothetical protein